MWYAANCASSIRRLSKSLEVCRMRTMLIDDSVMYDIILASRECPELRALSMGRFFRAD